MLDIKALLNCSFRFKAPLGKWHKAYRGKCLLSTQHQKWVCNPFFVASSLSLQMLHNKHVMVRVGGGWETFESYLLKHDPCRMLQISRVEGKMSPISSKSPNIKDLSPDSYLVVAANYRGKKWAVQERLDCGLNERTNLSVDIRKCHRFVKIKSCTLHVHCVILRFSLVNSF